MNTYKSKLPIKHSGRLFSERFLSRYDITVKNAAQKLYLHPSTLSRFLNGQIAVSCSLALKLEIATGVSAQFWIAWQNDYDLQQIEMLRKERIDAEPLLDIA
ncbi:addiction module antidote protein, HigA family [Aliidiomarina shirensis]|uniref:Addiction module antidote protein, HigA family n=1 Tax=Aliidiomarina shirensis TaxID=1048642 RepID=A0A432WP08_9GAMM|nr:HigA family addiction module antitoxin [Aliidiomarina shirensis]RUO35491.1 addiction module antidote protein, HigA family [Aliidiomarina shirensis]